MKFKEYFRENLMTVYRGTTAYSGGGHYWSTDREWARQFTQSGRDDEIKSKVIDMRTILVLSPLPSANDEGDIDNALKKAGESGYKGIMVSEGRGQPNSIYLL